MTEPHCPICQLPLTSEDPAICCLACKEHTQRTGHVSISTALGILADSRLPDSLITQAISKYNAFDNKGGVRLGEPEMCYALVHWAASNYRRNTDICKIADILSACGYADYATKVYKNRSSVWLDKVSESDVCLTLLPKAKLDAFYFGELFNPLGGRVLNSPSYVMQCLLSKSKVEEALALLAPSLPGHRVWYQEHGVALFPRIEGAKTPKFEIRSDVDITYQIYNGMRRLLVKTPFSENFVLFLKQGIPAGERRWDDHLRMWAVHPKHYHLIQMMLLHIYGVWIRL